MTSATAIPRMIALAKDMAFKHADDRTFTKENSADEAAMGGAFRAFGRPLFEGSGPKARRSQACVTGSATTRVTSDR